MNRKYYSAIYLDSQPTPADMILLDNNEYLRDVGDYTSIELYTKAGDTSVDIPANENGVIHNTQLATEQTEQWIVVKTDLLVYNGFWEGYLYTELQKGDSIKQTKTRLFSPISKDGQWNSYELHTKVPEYFQNGTVTIYLKRNIEAEISCNMKNTSIRLLTKD